MSGLRCGMRDLSLQHVGSSLPYAGCFVAALVAVHGLFTAARGLLSSCGVRVSSSLVVARDPEHMGSVVFGTQA